MKNKKSSEDKLILSIHEVSDGTISIKSYDPNKIRLFHTTILNLGVIQIFYGKFEVIRKDEIVISYWRYAMPDIEDKLLNLIIYLGDKLEIKPEIETIKRSIK